MKIDLINYSKPTIEELFSGSRKYKVPKYQRPFSWDKANAEKFWDDISKEVDDYFMGSIVFNKHKDFFEIVDGQQRITTISLFFLAIYLFYSENIDKNEAVQCIYPYLQFGSLTSKFQRLNLSRANEIFYKNLITTQSFKELNAIFYGDEVSNRNIIDVVNFFQHKLNENKIKDKNLEKKRIADLLDKIAKRVFFLEITVSDYKQASRLFEVLNNRGEDLGEADLVRNYLLSEIDRQNFPEDTMKIWDNIEEDINLKYLEKFIRYSTLLFSTLDSLYDRVIEYAEATSSKTVVDSLKTLADFYKKIIDPVSFGDDETEIKLLSELKILGVTQSHSILLAGYYKYDKNVMIELLNFLISFTFRYSSICGNNPNKLEKKYADLAYKIYNENLNLGGVKKEILTLNPDDNEFSKNFVSKEFKNNKIPRYILGKIENFISSEEKIIFDSGVHLEHIMPKKIDKWKEIDNSYESLYGKYVHNIGNMVLLSKKINTSIKNSLFKNKRDKYDDSEINLIKDIKNKKEWTEVEIKWNRDRYANMAKNIWNI